ncbi:Undecaprenyl-phosphate glucose phosphotransferase [Paraburkholderia sp. BL18I3N2]|uniref:undecaprenyl-phosphate glucose phosphotransferase n=1 Tax=unclassified Paraburkholderia TaxID=2615204 RepID=UPI000D04EFC7|nr:MULTISPECIES: undecaprenyl-phosphate glucose phosphotransferase [unclassified Paraburkholderia]PRX26068.1 Undecaprenyl-phosphate glucose phosphotransferase [Paraburkholderia sp. BL18I3N2]PRX90718.1 Undecaprenyl-phosphate glucose phosphotransferase [Paraburkholderia sp. BL25I1N1]
MLGIQGLLARLVDVIVIVAGALLASNIRFEDLAQTRVDGAFITFSVALALVSFPVFGLYESWRGRSLLRLSGQVSLAWLLVQAGGLVLMFSVHRTDMISRLWFIYWTATSAGGLIGSRLLLHTVLRSVRYVGMNLRNVAVVGGGVHCREVVSKVLAAPASGFRMSALFEVGAGEVFAPKGIPTFEDFGKFSEHVRKSGIQEIWLALPLSEAQTMLRFVNEFRDDLVNIRFIPDVRSMALFDAGVVDLIGAPAISLVASPLPARAMVQKEIFDRLFAALALLALTPLLLVIAITVKCSSRGPVFFTQYRKGADGQVFRIYKFRTMRAHAEKAGVVTQATKGDPRITRAGALLRKTSLDELPQFFNVLRGDMSVVGPRPHAIEHDEIYQKVVDGYIHRYRIKPGITGWAQINGFRGETDRLEKMQKRVEHDLYYLQNWSFGLDMRIVIATMVKGLVSSNAY